MVEWLEFVQTPPQTTDLRFDVMMVRLEEKQDSYEALRYNIQHPFAVPENGLDGWLHRWARNFRRDSDCRNDSDRSTWVTPQVLDLPPDMRGLELPRGFCVGMVSMMNHVCGALSGIVYADLKTAVRCTDSLG